MNAKSTNPSQPKSGTAEHQPNGGKASTAEEWMPERGWLLLGMDGREVGAGGVTQFGLSTFMFIIATTFVIPTTFNVHYCHTQ